MLLRTTAKLYKKEIYIFRFTWVVQAAISPKAKMKVSNRKSLIGIDCNWPHAKESPEDLK